MQKLPDLFRESFEVTNLAFPDCEDVPSMLRKLSSNAPITVPVALNFGYPELDVRRRSCTAPAVVTVPKTSVDEKSAATTSDDNVGLSGQLSRMESIPTSQIKQKATYRNLRSGILYANGAHCRRSLLLR